MSKKGYRFETFGDPVEQAVVFMFALAIWQFPVGFAVFFWPPLHRVWMLLHIEGVPWWSLVEILFLSPLLLSGPCIVHTAFYVRLAPVDPQGLGQGAC